MLFIVQQVAATAGIPAAASETMRVEGGNASLPAAIAADLGAAVITNAPVTQVRRANGVVGVTAGGTEHFGAHVVIAAPPPALRAVQFDPPLPAAIAAAIAGLDLGGATKVVNQFHAPFWRDAGESGYSLSDLTYRVSWDATDSYDASAGLLTTYTTANSGRTLAALPRSDRIDRVRADLALVFPESAAQLAGPAATMAWSNEPFTGGGYAFYRPNQVTAFWAPLRAGTDRIHFAGEHLEAPAGYMESAVRSGLRAASRLPAP
jgi:monoamine oxidase